MRDPALIAALRHLRHILQQIEATRDVMEQARLSQALLRQTEKYVDLKRQALRHGAIAEDP